jgi:transglutaminase-like putative cysteine protease
MEIYSPIFGELDAKVVSFQEEPVDGHQSKVIAIEVESIDMGKFALELDDSGHLLSTNFYNLIQYDRVKFMPLLPSGKDDIYVHNMVPINGKIGRAERIKRLSLVVKGKRANLFESGPTQRILDGGSDGSIGIIIDTGVHEDARNEITTKDRGQDSELISDTIADQEEIDKLAKQAVGNTTSTAERIDKLVKFVSEYIDDEYVFESSLHQLLTGKIGDCSEHALLFSALARSLGIPCRKVLGLVYMGDWCQGFGLHAWNEVMLDGYWKAVDASRGAGNIPPVYIRFPDDPVKLISLISSLHHMEISIEDIELMKDVEQ